MSPVGQSEGCFSWNVERGVCGTEGRRPKGKATRMAPAKCSGNPETAETPSGRGLKKGLISR